MRVFLYIALLLFAGLDVEAASWNTTCSSKNRRPSWDSMTDAEKAVYIDAELCLMSRPSQGDIEGASNRWDDVHWIHISQASYIHDVGAFLPWHRYYVRVHEYLLQSECNYTSGVPYWDEVRDAKDMAKASVFDPTTAFGGNGGSDNCVEDGPFAGVILHFNNSATGVKECLKRYFNVNTFALLAAQEEIDKCVALETFKEAHVCYEASPHNAGHAGIGGTMLDVRASPGDPLFFLHHANLDRLWWEWQQAGLSSRLTEVSSRNLPTLDYLERNNLAYPSNAFINYSGDDGNVTTLNHVLWMAGVMPNATIQDVMDLGGDLICAEYL